MASVVDSWPLASMSSLACSSSVNGGSAALFFLDFPASPWEVCGLLRLATVGFGLAELEGFLLACIDEHHELVNYFTKKNKHKNVKILTLFSARFSRAVFMAFIANIFL